MFDSKFQSINFLATLNIFLIFFVQKYYFDVSFFHQNFFSVHTIFSSRSNQNKTATFFLIHYTLNSDSKNKIKKESSYIKSIWSDYNSNIKSDKWVMFFPDIISHINNIIYN